jgi:hypothetical protein
MMMDDMMDLDEQHRRIVKDVTGYPVLGCAWVAVTGSN